MTLLTAMILFLITLTLSLSLTALTQSLSQDSSSLRSTSGAYELLFWESATCAQVAAETLKNAEWHTSSCVLGWDVQGIWPMFADGANVNSVERSHDGTSLVTSDDKGRLNLFKYPALQRSAQPKSQKASANLSGARTRTLNPKP